MVELFLQYDHWDEKSKIKDQTEKNICKYTS
jgi:hypothetical protein